MGKNKEEWTECEEEENYDYDELAELYDVQKKMEKHIKELWTNVIARYIDYCSDSQILDQLSSVYDYHIFHGYMVKNNTMYKYVLERINELENY